MGKITKLVTATKSLRFALFFQKNVIYILKFFTINVIFCLKLVMKFESKDNNFHSKNRIWKYYLQNVAHYISASVC